MNKGLLYRWPQRTLKERFEEKIYYGIDGCWYWLGTMSEFGYGWIHIGNHRNKFAHRVSMMLYKGIDPGKLCVLHSCDNRACVNPDHLRVGTHQENMEDRAKRSMGNKGERNGHAKLTVKDVLEIRASSEKYQRLASKYKVMQSTIWNIRHRKSWKHI